MTTARVGIVLVNWNGWRDTIACLESLAPALRGGLAQVVVVDNGSTDPSLAELARWGAGRAPTLGLTWGRAPAEAPPAELPAVTVLAAGANRGFAAGNNAGLRYLRAHAEHAYLWLLNNDATVEPEAVAALVAFADAHPAVGLVGSTIVDHAAPDRIQCAGGAFYDRRLTRNRAALAGHPRSAVAAAGELPRFDYICGAAMFMRATMVDEVGLLDEAYFLYYEEIDYARRAIAHGHELAWCRAAVVHHKGGASTGGNQPRRSALAEYHANLSCLKFTRRFEPRSFVPVAITRFALKTGYLVAGRQWHLLPTLVRAYVDYFRTPREVPR